jgi:broad specificity phosphatase PhoE
MITECTVLLVPHCQSVAKPGWTRDHLVRPLSDVGHAQARALVPAVGADVDAIWSSPAVRCLQTVGPLAAAAGLPVRELPELYETQGFQDPGEWVAGVFAPMGQAVAGAWIAGRATGAVVRLTAAHPGGRVVACSHGDVLPVLLALLAGAYGVPLPPLVNRGGWWELRFAGGGLEIVAGQARSDS